MREISSEYKRSNGYSLALRLLGDVAYGGPLLADDRSDILRGHQQSQRDVSMRRFGGHPRTRGATAGPAAGPVARAPAVIGPPLASLQFRGLIGNVGDA